MRSTEAISHIASLMNSKYEINLAFCVCDNHKFNAVVKAYRNGEVSLDTATALALETIVEQPSISLDL
ncbi:hypothetical protein J4N45_09840 [Vibrio sp. SCSIO 43140]|uniref:hypothetical protein n=1 Tax=Vibrio sp. SCSIO 43140 TaxID=2819100 RepID=UPI0020756102|nr:hypothetical protein [Vibrio sp. SCSIO 43140]USD58829.1 hypothetical protein J4N45_09840 [Vibrio sp. SCSIO 43140]